MRCQVSASHLSTPPIVSREAWSWLRSLPAAENFGKSPLKWRRNLGMIAVDLKAIWEMSVLTAIAQRCARALAT